MPSSRKYTPVVIDDARSDSDSSRSSSPSRKAVRFAEDAELITGVTRPLTPTEAWSLYYFETHARTCPVCNDPYHVILKGGRLCNSGHDLAYDVAMHVYHKDGIVYSTTKEKAREIRVEVPHGYDRLLALLKGMDRKTRKHQRSAPVVDYAPKRYPSVRRAPAVQSIMEEDEPTSPVFVQPYRPEKYRRSHHKSHHKSSQYSTVVIGLDDDAEYDRMRLDKNEKRGSLYKDARPRKEYRVEVRQSDHDSRPRREHRKEYYL